MSVRILASICIVAGLLVSGCASVPLAPPEQDVAAKAFKAPAGQSRVYVYRNESMGGAVKIPITVDGRMAAHTASKTYFVFDLAPGAHEIACIGETGGKVSLTTKANKSYYVWQEMKMGMWAANCAIKEVDEQTGQKGVNESKLAVAQ